MKETKKHKIEMTNRLNELLPEYQVTIINLINHLASHSFIYQSHAMHRIEKISVENPYTDDIEGFEKLTIDNLD